VVAAVVDVVGVVAGVVGAAGWPVVVVTGGVAALVVTWPGVGGVVSGGRVVSSGGAVGDVLRAPGDVDGSGAALGLTGAAADEATAEGEAGTVAVDGDTDADGVAEAATVMPAPGDSVTTSRLPRWPAA
jgi:hypothetical protein